MIIVISGPSGVGKSTIADIVLERSPGMVRSVSITTRGKRGREKDGVDYFFVSREDFLAEADSGRLLEWAEVHGNMYGTRLDFVEEQLGAGRDVLLEIDVQGGMKVSGKRPDALMIFILPPSIEELERRLRGRGTDSEEVIRRRLENAARELEYRDRYRHRVVNDRIDDCVEEVLGIITGRKAGSRPA